MDNHVAMENHKCPVCCTDHGVGVLLATRYHRTKDGMRPLRPFKKREYTTEWGMCPDCQKKIDDGYVALVGCDPEKSGIETIGHDRHASSLDNVYRTGRLAFVRRSVLLEMLKEECHDMVREMMLVPDEVLLTLQELTGVADTDVPTYPSTVTTH